MQAYYGIILLIVFLQFIKELIEVLFNAWLLLLLLLYAGHTYQLWFWIELVPVLGFHQKLNLFSGVPRWLWLLLLLLVAEISWVIFSSDVNDNALQRLFFLNGEQDLSSFLLVDIGKIKYPTYNCIISEPIFLNRRNLLAYEEVDV